MSEKKNAGKYDRLGRTFHNQMKQVSQDVVANEVMSRSTLLTLVSLDPLTFKHADSLLEISGKHLITPKYKVFIPDDLGKKFVFERNHGGQQYFYRFEATDEPGENGIEYPYEGWLEGYINSCTIHGTCSCGGTVVSTHGSINDMDIHEQHHHKRVPK